MLPRVRVPWRDEAGRGWLRLRAGASYPNLAEDDLLVLVDGINSDSERILFQDRDVTDRAKAGPVFPENGELGIPFYNGRTVPGLASVAINVVAPGTAGVALVTHPAGSDETSFQRLYSNKVATPGVFQLLSSGANGWLSSGVRVGNLTGAGVKKNEAKMFELPQTEDESATDGHASLPQPAAPTVTLLAEPGNLLVGPHSFLVVDVAKKDSEEDAPIRMHVHIIDRTNGRPDTFGPILILFTR